jgi:hypothetical protein
MRARKEIILDPDEFYILVGHIDKGEPWLSVTKDIAKSRHSRYFSTHASARHETNTTPQLSEPKPCRYPNRGPVALDARYKPEQGI